MTDDQLRPVVDSWLKATDASPPDPVGSVNLALSNVHRTRQFRRWWPLPIIDRFSSPPLRSPSRELAPRSVPATNGHSPVSARSTRAMVSTPKLLAGAVVVALIAGLVWSGILTPQPQVQLPGTATEQTDFIIVTGTSTMSAGGSPAGDDSMSDPRVSGHANLTNTYLKGEEDDTGVQWGQYTLANADGSWEGDWIGFYESPNDDDDYGTPGAQNAMAWASGSGDYEGWTYVANYTGRLLGLDVKGLLYRGDIPPTAALGFLETETQ